MKRRAEMFAFLLLWTALACAQESARVGESSAKGSAEITPSSERLTLQPTRLPLLTSEPADLLFGYIRCDSNGSVYVRKYQMDNPDRSPILKYDAEGMRQSTFSVTAVSPEFGGGDFIVSPGGNLYQVAWTQTGKDSYVLRFSKDGAFQSKVTLGASFVPVSVVTFSSGEMLVAGTESDKPERPGYRPPFTAIFDSSGKMVTRLTLEDDKAIQEAVERGDNNYVRDGMPGVNLAIELGLATAGTDGLAYLMRRTSPALIYAISSTGQVVRRLSVDPGDPSLMASWIAFSEGKLALLFSKFNHRGDPGDRALMVVNAQTGEEIVRYRLAKALGDGVACYSSEGFTFVGTTNRKVALYHVEPR